MLGWELPPHNSGGLGVACYQMCKALARRDVSIEFILPYTGKHDTPFMTVTPAHPQGTKIILTNSGAYDSYKYVYDDGHEEWIDIYGQQKVFEHAVARLCENKEYDIIHAHDWLTFRAGLRAKQVRNVPLILHVHSIERDRAGGNSGNPLVREIEETAMLAADRVLAVSQWTKDMIVEDYGIPADKIEVVHNSIEFEPFEDLEARNAYNYLAHMKAQGYKVVVNIGRLTVQKGLIGFLEAAKLVVEREPKTFFMIVGSGEQYFELIEKAARLGIAKNVLFTGFQRGKAWRDAFSIADLFVMPSVSEPFGLTPLESIGFGTPVLISKQSGVSEVLKNALKVDFWDINEMANMMLAVVREPALKHDLYQNSYHELQRLSWDTSADKMVGIYRQHLEGATA